MAEFEHTSKDFSSTSNPIPSPVFSQPITENMGSVFNHKLTGQNYLQWSQAMMMFLSGRSRDDYVTGNLISPPSTDPSFRSWRAENNQVMSWLISSIISNISKNSLLYTNNIRHMGCSLWHLLQQRQYFWNLSHQKSSSWYSSRWNLSHHLFHNSLAILAAIRPLWITRVEMPRWQYLF